MMRLLRPALGFLTVMTLALTPAVSPVGPLASEANAATLGSGVCAQTVGDADSSKVSVAIVGTDCVVTFKSGTNTWTAPAGVSKVDYLLVGGGGGGGGHIGGGGGAGEFIEKFAQPVSPLTVYDVQVGSGGSGGKRVYNNPLGDGGDGSPSKALAVAGVGGVTAAGGGGGGTFQREGRNGGSGGGAGGTLDDGDATVASTTRGGSSVVSGSGSGKVGGSTGEGNCSTAVGAGGGGSRDAGETTAANADDGGEGGAGSTSEITGSALAGGGGGGINAGNTARECMSTGDPGLGGGAGAGAGGQKVQTTTSEIGDTSGGWPSTRGGDATANSGSGGGGASGNGNTSSGIRGGGNGGSGIVVLRYTLTPDAPVSPTATASAGTVSLSWTAPSHTGGITPVYYIEYKSGSGDWTCWNRCGGSSATTWTISDLTNGVTYSFRISATNATVGGARSTAEVSATPVATAQTITFGSISDRTVGSESFSVSPSSSSGLPVSLASADNSVCTVSGLEVSIVAAGTCSLTATQGGDATYASASATQSFTVSSRGVNSVLKTGATQKGLSSTAEVIPTSVVVGSGFTTEMWVHPDSLPNSWNTLLYQHSTANTTSNYDRFGMNIRSSGRVQVILDASNSDAPGNDILNYELSGTTVPTGEWTHLALVVRYTGAKQFQAEVFIDGVGLGVVTKNTTNDLASPSSGEFRMGFNPAFSGREFNGQIEQFKVWNVALTDAQVAASMNSYQTSASTPPVSSLRLHHDFDRTYGSTVVDEVLGDGTYDLTYVNSPSTVSLTPTISTNPSNASISALDTQTLSVSASAYGDLDYQWQQDTGSGWSDIAGATSPSYETPALAVASSGIQYRVVVGSTVYYRAATATSSAATITVTKADQSSLSFTSASSMVFGQTIPLVAAGGSGSSSLSYAYVSGPCTVSGATVEATGAGSCVVTATRAADDNYNAKTSSNFTITVAKANQSINFTSSVPVSAVAGTTYTPAATASSGLSVSFDIAAPGKDSVCSISSGVVTFLTSGTCVIEADQGGTSNYNAASQVTQTIVAGKINQTITFPVISGKDFDDAAFLAGATVSSGRTVTYATSTGSVCAVNASTGLISIKTIGDCTVTASSAGNSSYAAASDVSRTFTISPVLAGKPSVTSVSFGNSSATVAFSAPGANGGDSIDAYQVVATSSGGSVTKPDCSTTSPCTISGLTNGESYTLTIAAINAAGVGPASDASPAVIPATIPDAVSALSTTPGDTQLVVDWSKATSFGGGDFTRYEVSLRVRGNSWGTPVSINDVNTETYTFTGLTNGTAYDVKIVTISTANGSELSSNTATALGVPATAPATPTGLTLASLSNTSAVASWTAPVDDGGSAITAYSVNLSCTFVNATDTFCTLTGLTAGSRVTVTVGATNLMGTGSTVSAIITMPGGSSGGSSGSSGRGTPATPTVTPAVTPTVLTPTLPGNRLLPRPPVQTPRILNAPVVTPTDPPSVNEPARVLVGGRPVPTLTEARGASEVNVRAGKIDLGLGASTPSPTSTVRTNPTTNAPELTVGRGESTSLNVRGLLPGSTLQVWLPGAEGRELARVPVNPDGSVTEEISLTASRTETPLPLGPQVLQVTGFDEDGNQTVVDMTINIAQGAPSPEPNRLIGELPDLQPGQSLATSAGVPETVTITANAETREVSVSSNEWSFRVVVPEENGTVDAEEPSAPTIRLIQARTAEVNGDGFQPDSRVDIFLFSDPTLLGSFTVNADGSFDAEVFLDARFAVVGDHTLQIQGVGTDGYVKAANLGVLVEEPPAPTTASQASLMLWWVIAAVIALALIIVLVFASRRHRVSEALASVAEPVRARFANETPQDFRT